MRFILGRALPGLDRLLPPRLGLPPPLPVAARPAPREDAPGRAEAEGAAVDLVLGKKAIWRSDDERRQVALERWRLLLMINLNSSVVGRQLVSDSEATGREPEVVRVLTDVFSIKASGTLEQRGGALRSFVLWAAEAGVQAFPVKEDMAYKYVVYLREISAAPTRAQRFVEALSFAAHTVGLDGAADAAGSRRVKGAAESMFLSKPPLKQRRALLVVELRRLEEILFTSDVMVDRLLAGFILFMTLGRLRHSDAQACSSLTLDIGGGRYGFLEGTVRRSKTSRTRQQKDRLLPVAVPAFLFREESWAAQWLSTREDAEVPEPPEAPIMPYRRRGGGWALRGLTVADTTEHMRRLLQGCERPAGAPEVGTHSCKATMLSWAAKWGLAAEDRRTLGYHVSLGDRTLAVYSRDLASAPLRRLCRIIDAVRLGRFAPDTTRSGLVVRNQDDPVSSEMESGDNDEADDEQDTDEGVDCFEEVCAEPDRTGPDPFNVVAVWLAEHGPVTAEAAGCAGPPDASAELPRPAEEEGALLVVADPGPDVLVGGEGNEAAAGSGPAAGARSSSSSPRPPSTTSSSSSSSEASGPHESEAGLSEGPDAELASVVGAASGRRRPARGEGAVWLQHVARRTLHRSRTADAGLTACGRVVTAAYARLACAPEFAWPRCGSCFGSAGIDEA